jgi:hypothetical protein
MALRMAGVGAVTVSLLMSILSLNKNSFYTAGALEQNAPVRYYHIYQQLFLQEACMSDSDSGGSRPPQQQSLTVPAAGPAV